jgi:hypothetical protein
VRVSLDGPASAEDARASMVDVGRELITRGAGYICEGPFSRFDEPLPENISCSGLVMWAAHRVLRVTEQQLQGAGLAGVEFMWSKLDAVSPQDALAGDLVFFTHRLRPHELCRDWHVMMISGGGSIVGSCPEFDPGPLGFGRVVECSYSEYIRKTQWQCLGMRHLPMEKLLAIETASSS